MLSGPRALASASEASDYMLHEYLVRNDKAHRTANRWHGGGAEALGLPERVSRRRFPEERRYVVRSGSERINGRLKDEFGARHVRVRGYDKVLAHLMFGMTVLTASQLMRLIVPPI